MQTERSFRMTHLKGLSLATPREAYESQAYKLHKNRIHCLLNSSRYTTQNCWKILRHFCVSSPAQLDDCTRKISIVHADDHCYPITTRSDLLDFSYLFAFHRTWSWSAIRWMLTSPCIPTYVCTMCIQFLCISRFHICTNRVVYLPLKMISANHVLLTDRWFNSSKAVLWRDFYNRTPTIEVDSGVFSSSGRHHLKATWQCLFCLNEVCKSHHGSMVSPILVYFRWRFRSKLQACLNKPNWQSAFIE